MSASAKLAAFLHPNDRSAEAIAICIAADTVAAQLARIAEVLEAKFGPKPKLPTPPVCDFEAGQ